MTRWLCIELWAWQYSWQFYSQHQKHKDNRNTTENSTCHNSRYNFLFSVLLEPDSGLVRLIFEVSRLHTIRHTHTSDRAPLHEWSAHRIGGDTQNKQRIRETNICILSGIRTRDPSNQVTAVLKPHCHPEGTTIIPAIVVVVVVVVVALVVEVIVVLIVCFRVKGRRASIGMCPLSDIKRSFKQSIPYIRGGGFVPPLQCLY